MKSVFLIFALLFASLLARVVLAAPALWQVTDHAGHTKAYLLGSIHFGEESLYPLPQPVMKAYHQSQALVVEVNTTSQSQSEIAGVVQSLGFYPTGTTVWDHLGTEDADELTTLLQRYGMEANRAKPWLLALQLASAHLQSQGVDQSLGVDQYFLSLSEQQRPILELESLESQLSIFNLLSEQVQLSFLMQTIHELGGESIHSGLLEAWQAGDLEQLEALIVSGSREGPPSLVNALFDQRNRDMASSLVQLFRQETVYFVVIGAGHLVGENNVRDWLVRQNFLVSQVEP